MQSFRNHLPFGQVDWNIPTIDTASMKSRIHIRSAAIALLTVYSTGASLPAFSFAPQERLPEQSPRKYDDEKKAAAQLATDTLKGKLSIDANRISVIHVSMIDWPDTSLGCPSAGTSYLQMITRGSLVLLKANKKAYRVHIGGDRAVVCEKPATGTLSGAGKALAGSSIQALMQAAKLDLAKRLGVAATEVFVTKVESATWENSALGCPIPKMDYIASKINGFRITLSRADQVFTYHTDQQNVIPCPAIESE